MSLSALVIEDQSVARGHLRSLLAQIDGVEWIGEAADGITALQLIRTARPDLVFLDIEMPGLSGLEVLRQAEPRPLAVFTTAYDRHAVTAFELQALDYVLKPFGIERLRVAVERARATAATRARVDQLERAEVALGAAGPITRVFARKRGRILPVQLDQVEHLQSQGDYVALREGTQTHLIRVPLGRLLERLDPTRFIRVHRSHVVNIERVSAFVPESDGRLRIVLESGTVILASKARTPQLRARLQVP